MISCILSFYRLSFVFFAYPCPRGKADCGIVTAIGIYRQLSRETALSWKNMTPVPKESCVTSNWAALAQLSFVDSSAIQPHSRV